MSTAWFIPDFELPPHIKCISTYRNGGNSQAPFNSFNLGTHVGDNPELVLANRASLPTSNPVAWLNQTHSDTVVTVEQALNTNIPLNADAVWTNKPAQVCAVMTADCLPVLIVDVVENKVAAVHCGWRGLAQCILSKTISNMSSQPNNLTVWLGPAIGPRCFEIGAEVVEQFTQLSDSYLTAFSKKTNGKYLANIQQLASIELEALGVKSIVMDTRCTVENEELFFSYRRDKQTGRMASLIWIE